MNIFKIALYSLIIFFLNSNVYGDNLGTPLPINGSVQISDSELRPSADAVKKNVGDSNKSFGELNNNIIVYKERIANLEKDVIISKEHIRALEKVVSNLDDLVSVSNTILGGSTLLVTVAALIIGALSLFAGFITVIHYRKLKEIEREIVRIKEAADTELQSCHSMGDDFKLLHSQIGDFFQAYIKISNDLAALSVERDVALNSGDKVSVSELQTQEMEYKEKIPYILGLFCSLEDDIKNSLIYFKEYGKIDDIVYLEILKKRYNQSDQIFQLIDDTIDNIHRV